MVISTNQFSDVSSSVGITTNERTWGANWVDFNGDTLPDIYVGNHQDFPSLYLNKGDGTFEDIAPGVLPFSVRDNHGAAWADYDNDGDADLMQVAGGATGLITSGAPTVQSVRNQLYVNNSGQFTDQATDLGVAYPTNRGRTPLWVDVDRDGKLDVTFLGAIQNNGFGKSTVFRQTDDKFVDVGSSLGFDVPRSPFGFLADFSGGNSLELNVVQNGTPRLVVYDYDGSSLINVNDRVLDGLSFPGAKDIAAADFNGDLRTDLYFSRTNASVRNSDINIDELGRITSRLTGRSTETGYRFNSSGSIVFDFFLNPPLQPDSIYIGSSGLTADNFDLELITREELYPGEWRLAVSPDDSRVVGLPSESERQDQSGVYIGYEPGSEQWTVLTIGEGINIDTVVSQETTNTFADVEPINFSEARFELRDVLFFGSEQGFVDATNFSNINDTLNAATSVAAGDYDNDMDVDLYVTTSEPSNNTSNIMYENQGDGTFRAVPNAAGAQGTRRGRADAVVSADYDLDGFLDLFITNGTWPPLLAEEGPHQLLRNTPNGNNWLTVDLEGVKSNRDGIGAKVYVTAGGVTQVRELSGGMHLYSQHHQRLHFGLAQNAKVDNIQVIWPDGRVQEANDIAANQLIRIVEEVEETFMQGAPDIAAVSSPGVFVWKETFDGPYKLRATGISGTATKYQIDLIASDSLSEVEPVTLNFNDRLTESEYGFSLDSVVGGFQDGVDFQLRPGTSALLSVIQNGVANPRQIYVGGEAGRLSPAGWILDSEDLPTRPEFTPGEDLGLFVGRGSDPSTVEFRWNGDGFAHRADLNVLSASAASFDPVFLGREDKFSADDNEAKVESRFRPWFDGIDVALTQPGKVGFTYEQDGLNQPHRVNQSNDPLLGFQNAYELPVASPYGRPEYDRSADEGLFLWKNEVTGVWRLRATAGGGNFSRFQGTLVSDQTIDVTNRISLEPDDVLDTSVPNEIKFDLRIRGTGEDGINFRLPEGASATLSLGSNADSAAQFVKVGAQQWEISALPLDLSGWDVLPSADGSLL